MLSAAERMRGMKRISTWLLMMAAVCLLAGCGAEQEEQLPSESMAETVPSTGQTVKTVDELLAAIEPGAEILLEPGTYNLSTAADYGKEDTRSTYYTWVPAGNGYTLRLVGVDDLTIRGGGMESATLETDAVDGTLMEVLNCNGVTLEDFAAGGADGAESSIGCVVSFLGCRDIAVNRVDFRGSNVDGVMVQYCSNLTIRDSRISQCSSSALSLYECSQMTLERCEIHDIGRRYGSYAVLSANNCSDLSIFDNRIHHNTAFSLLVSSMSTSVEMAGNQITGNRMREEAFYLYNTRLVLDGNTFENNTIRRWYPDSTSCAVDKAGSPISAEDLNRMNVRSDQEAAAHRNLVTVSTAEELLKAIAPDTEIVLDAALYDLSTAAGSTETESEYYYWEETYDGPELVIRGVDNLVIRSADGNREAHTLSAVPRYANVLRFNRCSNITLSGFTAGHTVEPGSCIGGVLTFVDCDEIQVDNCGLYGCGILGIQTENCGGVTVSGCDIYECSQGGIAMYGTWDIAIEQCTFRDLGGNRMAFSGCENARVDDKDIDGNVCIE